MLRLLPVFPSYFHMAWIMAIVKADVALEYDFITNKISIFILDHVLIITIIND